MFSQQCCTKHNQATIKQRQLVNDFYDRLVTFVIVTVQRLGRHRYYIIGYIFMVSIPEMTVLLKSSWSAMVARHDIDSRG